MMKEYQVEHQQQFETVEEESDRNSAYDNTVFSSPAKYDPLPSHFDNGKYYDELSKNLQKDEPQHCMDKTLISSREDIAKEKCTTQGNPYYDQSFSVANEKPKTSEKRHKKHKKKKILSFDTRRNKENIACLDELKIPNTTIRSPLSLSPVHFNTNQGTGKTAFTVDINCLSDSKPKEGTLISLGINPSYSVAQIDNQILPSANQCNYTDARKPLSEEYQTQPTKAKSELDDRWRSLPQKPTERLFWLSTCDVPQTPI